MNTLIVNLGFSGLLSSSLFVPRRKRAVKELLSQTSPILDQYTEAGLKGSLKIPSEWIEEAKVRFPRGFLGYLHSD